MEQNPTFLFAGSIMKNVFLIRLFSASIIFTITCLMVLCMPPKSHAVTLEQLRSSLPGKVMAWSRAGDDKIYTPQTIFDYINGGAEVYKAYNMRHCLSRRYTTAQGPAIVLDVFDMGTSKDAYGVFTHDPAGEVVELGQDGRLRPGWANFWKDRFFVSIYAEEETAAAQKAVQTLGKKVDALITDRGARPEIIDRLPPQGLQTTSIRYFHHPVILNYHHVCSEPLDVSRQCLRKAWRDLAKAPCQRQNPLEHSGDDNPAVSRCRAASFQSEIYLVLQRADRKHRPGGGRCNRSPYYTGKEKRLFR